MSSGLFDKTSQALATSINMRQLRQSLINSNIANAETPGYQATKLDFEGALERALDVQGMNKLSTSNDQHFALGSAGKVRPDIYANPEVAVNNDGNTVDLEKEMSALAENTLLHKAALSLINKKMAALKYAATDGR